MSKRKESRETLEARLRETASRVWLLDAALHRIVTLGEKPIATHTWKLDPELNDATITWEMFDPTGPMGGFVFTRFACPGQLDHSDVQRFDDLAHHPFLTLDERIACGKFTAAREEAFRAKSSRAA